MIVCVLLLFVYKCIVIGNAIVREEGLGVLLTDLTPPHFCAPPGFPTLNIVVFAVSNCLR